LRKQELFALPVFARFLFTSKDYGPIVSDRLFSVLNSLCLRVNFCRFRLLPGFTANPADRPKLSVIVIMVVTQYLLGLNVQKALIYAGVIVLAIGLLWPWLGKLPLGRLPGDFMIDRPGFKFYFPLTTMILVSVVASIILWLFRR